MNIISRWFRSIIKKRRERNAKLVHARINLHSRKYVIMLKDSTLEKMSIGYFLATKFVFGYRSWHVEGRWITWTPVMNIRASEVHASVFLSLQQNNKA